MRTPLAQAAETLLPPYPKIAGTESAVLNINFFWKLSKRARVKLPLAVFSERLAKRLERRVIFSLILTHSHALRVCQFIQSNSRY
ncbi:MAG TPA: hypothetical protein DD437_01420 [Rhodobiaceae bacterium]|nr:hypothetical protein [Rhodobiaceae bacterium]